MENEPKNEELELGVWEGLLSDADYAKKYIEDRFENGPHDTWPQYALNFITFALAYMQLGVLKDIVPGEKVGAWAVQLREAVALAKELDKKHPTRKSDIPPSEKEEVLSLLVFK